jgi:transposase
MMLTVCMAQTVGVLLCGDGRSRLEAIDADRNLGHQYVQRARIVLLSADGWSVTAIADTGGVSRPSVWCWQQRYAEADITGLLKDRTRPPGGSPLPEETELQVIVLACSEPPGEVTHWTGRALAKAVGILHEAVQRIWAKHVDQDLLVHRHKQIVQIGLEKLMQNQ